MQLTDFQVRPIPYYTQPDGAAHAQLAAELRRLFAPHVVRRLPYHHLQAFRHSTVIDFVARWKKEYPWFLRADIAKYYPSARPADIITMAQCAYRDLLSRDFVPRTFKQRYVPGMVGWARSLPFACGLPLGSAMSAILSAVALVPVWLKLQRTFDVKLMVYMDDVLLLARTAHAARAAWVLLAQELERNLGLQLNPGKTHSGKFAATTVTFAGWSFAGGYARVSADKLAAFREKIDAFIKNNKKAGTRPFLKCLNRKIDGFGNYYKFGDVHKQFETLDKYVRTQVRRWLCRGVPTKRYTNAELSAMGLHGLASCYRHAHRRAGEAPRKQPLPPPDFYAHKPAKFDYGTINDMAKNIQTIAAQMPQLLRLQRRMVHLLDTVSQC